MQKRAISWHVPLPHANSPLWVLQGARGPESWEYVQCELSSCVPKSCPVRDSSGYLRTVTELCPEHCKVLAPVLSSLHIGFRGCIQVKLYLQRHTGGWVWPVGLGLPRPDVEGHPYAFRGAYHDTLHWEAVPGLTPCLNKMTKDPGAFPTLLSRP